MENYYIKVDENGNSVGHPVALSNLQMILGVGFSDEKLAEESYIIIDNDVPEVEPGQDVHRTGSIAAKEGGGWQWVYEIITHDQDFLINRLIRHQRLFLLRDTDWAVLPDSPLSDDDKAEYTTYRQALRDMTSNQPDVKSAEDVTWPTPPWAVEEAPIPDAE